jgi:hypothetical protein
MIKYFFTTALIAFQFSSCFAQALSFDWTKKWSTYTAFDIASDDQGNIYTLSSGNTQVNFNPAINPTIMGPTAGCGAISKFDANGNLIWVKFITKTGGTGGVCEPKKIFIKGNHLYYAGEFGDGGGTYDFDFSVSSVFNIGGSCNGCGKQVFVSKLDLDGNFQWCTYLGNKITVNDIYVDQNDNVYFTGGFQETISINSYSITSNGHIDAYICKLNSQGSAQWIKSLGSNSTFSADEVGVSVKVNSSGEIIFVGNFQGTIDIDPGIANIQITSLGSTDAFLLKLSQNGSLIDYRIIGGADVQRFEGLEITPNDEIILSGVFSGVVDFDLSANQNVLNSPSFGSFIAKYSSQFNLLWAKAINGASTRSMTRDVFGRIYVAGTFSGTVDFDPSASVNLHSSGIGGNSFILQLDSQGNYYWSGILQTGSNTNISGHFNEPTRIITKSSVILFSGAFASPVDFDPGPGVFTMTSMTSPNGYQQNATAFILKLNQCIPTASTQTVSACASYQWSNGQVYNQSGVYTSVAQNAAGCDSTVTLNLTINNPINSSLSTTSCGNFTSPSGNVYTASGIYTDTISTVAGCDSVITINLTVQTIDTVVTRSGNTLTALQSGATYQWINCTTNQPINGASGQSYNATSPGWYAVMVTINGCSELSACKQIKKVSLPNPPINGTADLDEEQLNNVLIYPNPANDQITIEYENPNEWEVELIDVSGRKVLRSINEKVIDISGINPGMYRVIVRSREFQFQQALVKM